MRDRDDGRRRGEEGRRDKHRDHGRKRREEDRSRSREPKEKRPRREEDNDDKRRRRRKAVERENPAERMKAKADEKRKIDRHQEGVERGQRRRSRSRSGDPTGARVDNRREERKGKETAREKEEEEDGKERLSLSVDETNRLRIKVGLRPLGVGAGDGHRGAEKDARNGERGRGRRGSRSRPGDPTGARVDIKREDRRGKEAPDEEEEDGGGDERLSLSVDETNKLRIKLGLKPLTTNEDGKDSSSGAGDGPGFVHAPAVNIGLMKREVDMKEKIRLARETRELEKRLFGEEEGKEEEEVESAADWVEKNRLMAERQQKQEEEENQQRRRRKESEEDDVRRRVGSKSYRSTDLLGLRVEHDLGRFDETRGEVVLVLKDRGLLEEGDDSLVNVNMLDDERTASNLENRRRVGGGNAAGYNPYEEYDDFDESGNRRERTLLSKYDEVIGGGPQKRDSFVIGMSESEDGRMRGGRAGEGEAGGPPRPELVGPNAVRETLRLPPPVVASDFDMKEETIRFRKPRTVKKGLMQRRRGRSSRTDVVRADDLLPLEVTNSRPGREVNRDESSSEVAANAASTAPLPNGPKLPTVDELEDIVRGRGCDDDDDDDILGCADEGAAPIFNDRDWLDEELTIKMTERKPKREEESTFADLVVVKKEPLEEEQDKENLDLSKGNIRLNTAATFCYSLGLSLDHRDVEALDGRKSVKGEEREFKMEVDETDVHEKMEADDDDDSGRISGWKQVGAVEEGTDKNNGEEEEDNTFLVEPKIDKGLGSVLRLASTKGYLETAPPKKEAIVPRLNYHYVIDDKRRDDSDCIGVRGRQGRGSGGPSQPFMDLDNYRPEVKLEYLDDQGNQLNKKEAFRDLSHKFHGKGSGFKKTEKRMLKRQREEEMKKLMTTEGALKSFQLMEKRQKKASLPYVVMGKGGAGAI